MIEKLIAYCARRPFLVMVLTLVGVVWGVYALRNISIDAIPDLSDPQVIIVTDWKGRSPDLIEDQLTFPIVTAMVAAPKAQVVRGFSMFGTSFVYVIFEEGTGIYWGRSRVLEYLNQIQGQLPEGVNPVLGPDATGVGWILSYALVDESGKNSIEDLRAFQDWKLRYVLEAIPGVAEVATVGGFQKQYQIQINPNALAQYGLTLKQIADKVRASNRDVGGRILEMSEREYFVRGLGYLKSIQDLEDIPLKITPEGAPVVLKDVANVTLVPEIRRGAVDLNGKGEAVSGIVVMRFGENAYEVIERVKETLEKFKPSLPEGTELILTYDRSKVIGRSIDTLTKKLTQELLIVALIIILFLWHFRSALVPILTLPIAILFSFIPMFHLGISSNIMSLGGILIAVGTMVDASIVIVENAHKNLERWNATGRKEPRFEVLLRSIQEVGRHIFFSLLVIAVSFLPIFALQGQEGRLFKPLAFTKNAAMFFAALLSITLVPPLVIGVLKLPKKIRLKGKRLSRLVNFFWAGEIHAEENHPISRVLFKIYTPILRFFLHFKKTAILFSALLILISLPIYTGMPEGIRALIPKQWSQASGIKGLVGTYFSWEGLGQEFLPPLNEGDILYMPTTLPGISIEAARTWLQQQDKTIRQFPEVESVFGKVGRADSATDSAPLNMVETVIQLKPPEAWPPVYHSRWYSNWAPDWLKVPLRWVWPEFKPRTWEELIAALDQALQMPATPNAWLFPIRTRIDMLTTGIRTPVGVKVFGDDLTEIERLALKIEELVQQLPGTRSVVAERSVGGYYLDIQVKREKLPLYGMQIEDAQQVIEGVIGSERLTTTVEGRERYPVNMRYLPAFRQDPEALKRSLVTVTEKRQIPLGEIAEIQITKGPAMIKNEGGLLTSWVFVDLAPGQDIGSYVKKLEKQIKQEISFPPGYTYSISGQYEFMERAKERLMIVIPITLFIIVMLLFINTRSWMSTFIILLAVPFSLIGAIWLLYFLDYNMSIAVWVGLIALAGIDAENGVIMLLYLDLSYQRAKNEGRLSNKAELKEAVLEGAVKRIRPKLMTVLTDFFGLLPIMWAASFETGADMTKRIAAPIVGGIFTSFLMELLIYPCIFMVWKWRTEVRKNAEHANSLGRHGENGSQS